MFWAGKTCLSTPSAIYGHRISLTVLVFQRASFFSYGEPFEHVSTIEGWVLAAVLGPLHFCSFVGLINCPTRLEASAAIGWQHCYLWPLAIASKLIVQRSVGIYKVEPVPNSSRNVASLPNELFFFRHQAVSFFLSLCGCCGDVRATQFGSLGGALQQHRLSNFPYENIAQN